MIVLNTRNIAHIMGGEVTGRNTVNVPGPGHGKTDRSLSIKLDPRAPSGFVVWSFAGDDPIDCRDYVRERLGLEPWGTGRQERRPPFVVTDAGPDQAKARKIKFALKLWEQSVDPVGTIVERYLHEHRGLELPSAAKNVIRLHGSLYFTDTQRLPGMVCLLRDIFTDKPVGIHRTFLNRETAEKIDRKMLGVARNAAIKIDALNSLSDRVTLGEGVETALSARAAGLGPAWAVGSSGAVRAFPIIAQFSEITILQENDSTSRADTTTLARRYLRARKPVNIVKPHVGNDFNDVWRTVFRTGKAAQR